MKTGLVAIALLAMMGVAVFAPVVRAAPILHELNVTITTNGRSSTATLLLADVDGDGLVTATVSPMTLSQIEGAFGTTTFNFPGSFKGTFHVGTFTIALTLQSDDVFVLKFVSA